MSWRVRLLNLMASHRLPTPRRALAGGALLVVPLLLGGGAWWGMSVRDAALSAKADLVAARAAFATRPDDEPEPATAPVETGAPTSLARFDRACASTSSAHQSLERVRGQIGLIQPVIGALDLLPGDIGARAKTQGAMLDAGAELAAVGAALCRDLRPVASGLGPPNGATAGGSLAEALRALAASRPSLLETADRLERLGGTLEDVPEDAVDGQDLAQLRAQAPELAQTLRDSAALLALMGGDRPTRFLLVSQNPDELRPTGGYIGSAGVVEIVDGAPKLLEYGSSRQYDTPPDRRAPVPAEIAPFLRGEYWHLAAANWRPSFPDAARQIEYFYGLARPDRPVDGVVAIDQYGLALVLEALGPVDVPEYGERVGAADVQAAIDRHVHTDQRDENRRKQFTAALTAAVMQRALTAPADDLPKLSKAVRSALDRQQLIVSVRDPAAARLFSRKGWDGRLLDAPGDYLLITDSELNASKDSQRVRRDASYRVDLADPGAPRARLELTYTNRIGEGRVYRSLVRVYAPAGAQLLDAAGFDAPPSVSDDCGRVSFAAPLTVAPGASQRVVLTYALPSTVLPGGAYDLVVQHQPGVPEGSFAFRVGDATAEASVARGEHLHWRLTAGALAAWDPLESTCRHASLSIL